MDIISPRMFDDLPEEIILSIFGHFDPSDLNRCCQVSQKWRRIASDPKLWHRLFPNFSEHDLAQRDFLYEKLIFKFDDIYHRFNAFSKELPKNEVKLFRVHFFYQPQYNMELRYSNGTGDEERAMVRSVYLLKKFTEVAQPERVSAEYGVTRHRASLTYELPTEGQLSDVEKFMISDLVHDVDHFVQKKFRRYTLCVLCIIGIAVTAFIVANTWIILAIHK